MKRLVTICPILIIYFGAISQSVPRVEVTRLWTTGLGQNIILENESFEAGLGNFTNSGGLNWTTTSSEAQEGTKSATSNVVFGGQNAILNLIVDVPTGYTAMLSFYILADTIQGPDMTDHVRIGFEIDAASQSNTIIPSVWTQKTYFISQGIHTLTWKVFHQSGASDDQVQAFLDHVVINYNRRPGFRMADGSHGFGKILMSDAHGNASWKTLSEMSVFDNANGSFLLPLTLDGRHQVLNPLKVIDGNGNGIQSSSNLLSGFTALGNGENGYRASNNGLNGFEALNNEQNGFRAFSNDSSGYMALNNFNGFLAENNTEYGYIARNNTDGGYYAENNGLYGYYAIDNNRGFYAALNTTGFYSISNSTGFNAHNNSSDGFSSTDNLRGFDASDNSHEGYRSRYNLGDGFLAETNDEDGFRAEENTGHGYSAYLNTLNGYYASENSGDGFEATGNGGYGVYAWSNSDGGFLAYGNTSNGFKSDSNTTSGFRAINNGGDGLYAAGNGANGAYLSQNDQHGVKTYNNGWSGLESSNNGDHGLYAYGNEEHGLYSTNNDGSGVYSYANAWYGIDAHANSLDGIYSHTNIGDEGYFSGTVTVTGNLSKGGGSFKIDHPLDPENKFLYHSFVESPDMMNVYNGNAILDGNGEAIIEMEAWFEPLNRDFRYQLTALGAPGPNLHIAEEINNNHFKIAGGTPGMKVSWQVTGIRQDPYANQNRIEVEVDKPEEFKGYYIHPEAYGRGFESGFDFVKQGLRR